MPERPRQLSRGTSLVVRQNLELDPLNDVITDPDTVRYGRIDLVGLLPDGMVSGRAAVALLVTLADGTHVIAETSWRVFHGAASVLATSPVAEMENL